MKRVVARAARLEMFGLRSGKRERGGEREMQAGRGRILPPSYTLSSLLYGILPSSMCSARPARHGSATGFLSNPIATRWNSCSARHGDAPSSSYSIWILLRHGLALPSLFSSPPNFVQGRSPRLPFIRSSLVQLLSLLRPNYFEETTIVLLILQDLALSGKSPLVGSMLAFA